jgi:predicted HTH domain antitoxin
MVDEKILNEINQVNEKIKNLNIEVYSKNCKLIDLKKANELIEMEEMQLIVSEKEENGKNKYSNETSRSTELNIRMRNDNDYKNNLNEIKSLGIVINLLMSDLEFERNKFKILLELIRSDKQ